VQRLPVRIRLDPQSWRRTRCGRVVDERLGSTRTTAAAGARSRPSVELPLETKAYEHALADAARLEHEIVQANLGQAAPRRSSQRSSDGPLTPRQRASSPWRSRSRFMNVLDLAIANVAIPQLAGELARARTRYWVITSFAVSAAIAMR